MVVIHPIFYPEQSSQVRRKIFNFVKNALTAKKFDPTAINRLIKP